jgi:ATP-dependent RNA helicase DHX29
VTHVIVDEVHERSVDSDFLILVLRRALATHPHLRVVLMSATADADLFAAYFHGAPVVSIPGRMYPVSEFYLEDICRQIGVCRGSVSVW